jgi:hypothetical protein
MAALAATRAGDVSAALRIRRRSGEQRRSQTGQHQRYKETTHHGAGFHSMAVQRTRYAHDSRTMVHRPVDQSHGIGPANGGAAYFLTRSPRNCW